MLKLIRTALGAFFKALPSWFRTRYLRVLLLIPIIWYVITYMLADANFMGWSNASTAKDFLEIVHPSLLASGVALGLLGFAITKNSSLLFISVMCTFGLAREIGGQGTSIILYLGLIALITYGYANRDKVQTLLQSRLASSCMATTFICYLVSQLLDRGVIKRIGWLFIQDTTWVPPYSSQIEESLESLGGAFLLATVAVLIVLAIRQRNRNRSE
ncbi:MAG: hypothetical protein QGH46_09410 [Gammaproteobacteria bacterium]|nr:hypothetical protein [Gammaproteobacteria bacterium]MDP7270308.1 hypothetical protein [Gammaproteobacteria bacterium]HJP05254.1 hypothetical protein [Gammaproteobacteria bacterium]